MAEEAPHCWQTVNSPILPVEWLRRKQEAVTSANYEVWLNSLFNMKDPAQAQIREKIDPDYFKKRVMWIEERAELEKELAKLSLYGYPQNEAQTKLLFMLSTGQIKAPRKFIEMRALCCFPELFLLHGTTCRECDIAILLA